MKVALAIAGIMAVVGGVYWSGWHNAQTSCKLNAALANSKQLEERRKGDAEVHKMDDDQLRKSINGLLGNN